MKKIAIVTDTDSSLPYDLCAQYGIRQVGINLHIDGATFETSQEFTDRVLFEKVKTCKAYPTTSAPTPSAFVKAFDAAKEEGAEEIICICISRNTSATYDSAILAAEQVGQEDIVVVDSLNLSMGQGFMVLTAAEMAQNGATRTQILEHLAHVGERIHTFAVLPTLKYIGLSGRLSKFSAGLADTLDIKPILTVTDGKLEVTSKQRTLARAIEKMLDMIESATNGRAVMQRAVFHVNSPEKALELHERVSAQSAAEKPFIITEFTPGLSLHSGPGTIGISTLIK